MIYSVLLKFIPSKTISIILPLNKIAITEYKPISISLKTIKFTDIIITSIIINIVLVLNVFENTFMIFTNKSDPPVEPLDLNISPNPIPN